MKRWFLTLVACLISSLVAAQVPVPYQFQAGTPASATQVNANFAALSDGALNVSGGVLTGNMTVNPGVTIDGIDLSEVFGGTGNKILTVDGAKLISKAAPQFTIGFDPTHTVTWTVDVNGNSILDSLASGTPTFTFSDPVIVGTLTATSINTTNFGCSGCIGASQIADGSIGAAEIGDSQVGAAEIADGTVGAAEIADGTVGTAEIADGTLTGADIANGSIAGIDITDDTIAGIDITNESIASADILNGSVSGLDILDETIASADILNGSVAGIDILDGTVGPADLANTGVSAAGYGSATQVATFTVDAQGRLTLANNVAIAFPTPPASYALGPNQIPENAINNDAGTLILRPGDTVSITGGWTFSTATTFSGALSVTGAGYLTLPNGIAEEPSLRFTSCLTCGLYYNGTNNTTEIGSRFTSANRATMRAYNSGPSKLDFLVGVTVPLEIGDSMVSIGPVNAANLVVRGDVMPPTPNPTTSNGLYYVGGGAPYYWNSMWALYGFQTPSNDSWKDRVGTIRNALAAIDELEPFIATWKKDFLPEDDGTPFVTFSAQQVQSLVDRRYGTKIAREPAKGKGEGLSLDYGKFSPILWQATRELHAKSKEQDKKIEALQLVIAALEIRLADHKH